MSYYAAYGLFKTDVSGRPVRSHLQESSCPGWALKIGPIGSSETSVLNHPTPRNNPENVRIQLNRSGSLWFNWILNLDTRQVSGENQVFEMQRCRNLLTWLMITSRKAPLFRVAPSDNHWHRGCIFRTFNTVVSCRILCHDTLIKGATNHPAHNHNHKHIFWFGHQYLSGYEFAR